MRAVASHLCPALVVLAFSVASAFAQSAREPALNDAGVQRLIGAMASASTWYHPDLEGEFTGVRAFAHRRYGAAMKAFERGAFYADKLSQLCIGLMYLNGNGVRKGPVTALAWIDLAAERGHPAYLARRDSVRAQLSEAERQRAEQIEQSLRADYADGVAKPRLVKQVRQGQMQLTGSRAGADVRNALGAGERCSPCIAERSVVIGAGLEKPVAGCGGASLNARARWDPKRYFAARDSLWTAHVEVGPVAPNGPAGRAGESPGD